MNYPPFVDSDFLRILVEKAEDTPCEAKDSLFKNYSPQLFPWIKKCAEQAFLSKGNCSKVIEFTKFLSTIVIHKESDGSIFYPLSIVSMDSLFLILPSLFMTIHRDVHGAIVYLFRILTCCLKKFTGKVNAEKKKRIYQLLLCEYPLLLFFQSKFIVSSLDKESTTELFHLCEALTFSSFDDDLVCVRDMRNGVFGIWFPDPTDYKSLYNQLAKSPDNCILFTQILANLLFNEKLLRFRDSQYQINRTYSEKIYKIVKDLVPSILSKFFDKDNIIDHNHILLVFAGVCLETTSPQIYKFVSSHLDNWHRIFMENRCSQGLKNWQILLSKLSANDSISIKLRCFDDRMKKLYSNSDYCVKSAYNEYYGSIKKRQITKPITLPQTSPTPTVHTPVLNFFSSILDDKLKSYETEEKTTSVPPPVVSPLSFPASTSHPMYMSSGGPHTGSSQLPSSLPPSMSHMGNPSHLSSPFVPSRLYPMPQYPSAQPPYFQYHPMQSGFSGQSQSYFQPVPPQTHFPSQSPYPSYPYEVYPGRDDYGEDSRKQGAAEREEPDEAVHVFDKVKDHKFSPFHEFPTKRASSLCGSGGFGEVHCIIFEGKKVALKMLRKKENLYSTKDLQDFVLEFNHQYTLYKRCEGYIPQPFKIVYNLELTATNGCYSGEVGYLMEYCEVGSVSDLGKKIVQDKVKCSEKNLALLIFFLSIGMIEAVFQVKQDWTQLSHHDIKPQNFLVKRFLVDRQVEYRVILSDFGLSADLSTYSSTRIKTKEECPSHLKKCFAPATFVFSPPEMMSDSPQPSRKGDLYSLGLSIYSLFQGFYPPFSCPHRFKMDRERDRVSENSNEEKVRRR
ncbi:hypothetical protein ADUPG1_010813 [Aduncisulcus paluster]|uniref:Protein kinase domain-containing protein n=1 Tax=Aduncisulcus paluster TaxID=2918883 RepID=A0ABQ5JSY4_9EUKA|nr:hypothetical protein ADUPG1_010813 [Aduncisulcus paluster]